MGYAIAQRAQEKGFKVTLISGPTHLKVPKGVQCVSIVTVRDLERALRRHFPKNDILIMSAAVGDFIPEKRTTKKIPRRARWQITFRQSPDLVRRVAQKKGRRLVIGFSLETGRWIKRSQKKMVHKNLDGIVANYFSSRHNPFGSSKVHAALINGKGSRVVYSRSKFEFAGKLMDWVGQMTEGKSLKK
jgi:phosphopantothenoylcysteine decarboxylase/phosphopantothenate--cysteine ligase